MSAPSPAADPASPRAAAQEQALQQAAEFPFEPVPSSVPAARRFAAGWLAQVSAAESAQDTALLLISELVTNVQLHARTPGLLSLVQEGRCLQASVADGSRARPRTRRLGQRESTGRGVRLLGLADEWDVEPDEAVAAGGKRIWFTLALRPSAAEVRAQERAAAAAFGADLWDDDDELAGGADT